MSSDVIGTADRRAAAPADARRPRVLEARWLGRVAYAEALALQAALVRARRADAIADRLLLLEHPHVITLGTSAHAEHVCIDADERAARGVEVFETGRGGDVTYHGPGQLVGYPILDLKPDRTDLHRYVRDIETALIRALADFGVAAGRVAGLTGVWVGDRKIAAIGVRVSSGWITSHGFALNVSTDLAWFETIVPCGIADRGVTSLAIEAGRALCPADVLEAVSVRFGEVFERTLDGPEHATPDRP
jgi:lipoyl(octanoyl) transferase